MPMERMTGDYISREAAIKAVSENDCEGYATWAVKAIPTVEVRPVARGKWEDVHINRPEIEDLEVASMFCPHCNRWHNEVYQYGNPTEMAHFCPNCGAWMEES